MGSSLIEDWLMGPEISPPYAFYQVEVLVKGFLAGTPQMFGQRILLLLPSMGQLPRAGYGFASPEGSNSASHPGKCCCLVPVECVAVAGLLGWEGEGMGSLDLIVSLEWPLEDW